MRDHACSRQPRHGGKEPKSAQKKEATCLVQRLVVYARAKHRDGDGPTLGLQLARAALEYRGPVPRDKIHLVHEQEHGRLR